MHGLLNGGDTDNRRFPPSRSLFLFPSFLLHLLPCVSRYCLEIRILNGFVMTANILATYLYLLYSPPLISLPPFLPPSLLFSPSLSPSPHSHFTAVGKHSTDERDHSKVQRQGNHQRSRAPWYISLFSNFSNFSLLSNFSFPSNFSLPSNFQVNCVLQVSSTQSSTQVSTNHGKSHSHSKFQPKRSQKKRYISSLLSSFLPF